MLIETLGRLFVKVICMVLFGAFLRKKNIITKEMQAGLSSLLLNAILPVSVISSAGAECTPEALYGLLLCAGVSVLYYFLAFAAAKGLAAGFKMEEKTARIFISMNMFANVGFLGMPLAEALCGKEGLLIAVVYNMAYQVFLVAVGIPLMQPKEKISWKLLADPLLLISIAAIVLFVSPFRLPDVLQETCDDIGSMMVPVSMMIIGSDLADQELREIFQDRKAYLVCGMRLLVYPVILFAGFRLCSVPENIVIPMVLLTALPCGSLNVILAKQYDCEPEFAARTVILSMVLMVVTLPGMIALMSFL